MRASRTLCALLALYALRALRASHTDGLRGNGSVLNGEGHNAAGIYIGNNNGACQALVTLRPLLACVAFLALRAGIAFQAGNNGFGTIIGYCAIGEFQAAALRRYCAIRRYDDVAGRPGGFPCLAVIAGFQHLVAVKPDVFHIASQDPLSQLLLYGRCCAADVLCAHAGGSGQGVERIHKAVVCRDYNLTHHSLYGELHFTDGKVRGGVLPNYPNPVAVTIGKYCIRGIGIAVGCFDLFKHSLPPVLSRFSVLYCNVLDAERLRIAIGEAEPHFIKVSHIQLSAQHLRSCIGTPCPFRPVYILP